MSPIDLNQTGWCERKKASLCREAAAWLPTPESPRAEEKIEVAAGGTKAGGMADACNSSTRLEAQHRLRHRNTLSRTDPHTQIRAGRTEPRPRAGSSCSFSAGPGRHLTNWGHHRPTRHHTRHPPAPPLVTSFPSEWPRALWEGWAPLLQTVAVCGGPTSRGAALLH